MTQIDKEAVERLSRTMNWYGNHWKVGDDSSEQHAADCDKASDTLLTLLTALNAAEAERKAADELANAVAYLETADAFGGTEACILDALNALKAYRRAKAIRGEGE
jgi:bifunctional ADP-heptose synthase (sugar kinase/adenylyltransferase)